MAYLVTHFILVAGHEYSTKGLDFDKMCTHRAQEWIDTLRAKVRSKGTFSSIHYAAGHAALSPVPFHQRCH